MAFSQKFTLEQLSDGACNLRVPSAIRGPGAVKRTKTLPNDLSTEKYMINLDYDAADELLGIEVVCFD